MKGGASLIVFLNHLPFVYGRDNYSCDIILYPAILLKVFISSMSFLLEILGPIICKWCFDAFFPMGATFISYSSLVSAKIWCIVLNNCRESGQLCLVYNFNFSGIFLSFSSFSLMSFMGLLLIVSIHWDMSFIFLNSPELLLWRDIGFCQRTFKKMIMWFLSFSLFI